MVSIRPTSPPHLPPSPPGWPVQVSVQPVISSPDGSEPQLVDPMDAAGRELATLWLQAPVSPNSFLSFEDSPLRTPSPQRPGFRRMLSCPSPTSSTFEPGPPPPYRPPGPVKMISAAPDLLHPSRGSAMGEAEPWSLPCTPAECPPDALSFGGQQPMDSALAFWLQRGEDPDQASEERAWRIARESLRQRDQLGSHTGPLCAWLMQSHQRLLQPNRPAWALAQWANFAPTLLTVLCSFAQHHPGEVAPGLLQRLQSLSAGCCGLRAILAAQTADAALAGSRLLLALAKFDSLVPLYLGNVVRQLSEDNDNDQALVQLAEALAARGLRGSTTALGLSFAVVDNFLAPAIRAAREPFGPRAGRASAVWSLLKLTGQLVGPTGVLLVHARNAAILRDQPDWVQYARQQLQSVSVRSNYDAERAVLQAQHGAWVAEALRPLQNERALNIALRADESLKAATQWAHGRTPMAWQKAAGRIVASLAPTLFLRPLRPSERRGSGEEMDAAFGLTREVYCTPDSIAGAGPLLAFGLPQPAKQSGGEGWQMGRLGAPRLIGDQMLLQVLGARMDGQLADVVVAARISARLFCAHQRRWPPEFSRLLLRDMVDRLGRVGVSVPVAWKQALIAASFNRSPLSAALGPPVVPSRYRLKSIDIVRALETLGPALPSARDVSAVPLSVQVEHDAYEAALEALIEEMPLPGYADKTAAGLPPRELVAELAVLWERLAHAVGLPALRRATSLPAPAILAALARSQPMRWAVLLSLGYWPENAPAPLLAEAKLRFAYSRLERRSGNTVFRTCPLLLEAWLRAVEAAGPPQDSFEVQSFIDERATLQRELRLCRLMGAVPHMSVSRSGLDGTATP